MPAFRLIAGLGNPGKQYAMTRHNAGFWLLDELARSLKASSWKTGNKFFADIAHVSSSNLHNYWLLKPSTYMNNSGQAIAAFAKFQKITAEDILIVHDELDLPAGIARFKNGGGHNGHNGLKSIIDSLGSNNFWRLRMGINPPPQKGTMKDYVLSTPQHLEKKYMMNAIANILAIFPLIFEDMEKAMQILHSQKLDAIKDHSSISIIEIT
jgi:PTH1 family peptidyl-tRNA hydrolase